MVSPKTEKGIDAIIARLPNLQAAMLPALHLIQEELGYVPVPEREWLAEKLGVSPAVVEAVLSFYTLLRREPEGKYVIWVCSTLPCALRGCEQVIEHLRKILGVREGETTPDGRVTLKRAECLGACDRAPVLQVNEEFHGPVLDPARAPAVSFERLGAIVEKLT